MALFKKHKTEPVPPEDTGAHDTSVGLSLIHISEPTRH